MHPPAIASTSSPDSPASAAPHSQGAHTAVPREFKALEGLSGRNRAWTPEPRLWAHGRRSALRALVLAPVKWVRPPVCTQRTTEHVAQGRVQGQAEQTYCPERDRDSRTSPIQMVQSAQPRLTGLHARRQQADHTCCFSWDRTVFRGLAGWLVSLLFKTVSPAHGVNSANSGLLSIFIS